MGQLSLATASTGTTISSSTNNSNIANLLTVVNGGIDGTHNLAAGAVGASGNADLSSNIAGSGLALSGNQLSVSGLTHLNLASSGANITGSQIASDSITSLAANAQCNGLNVVVSNTNATNQLAVIRATVAAGGGITGEGVTASDSSGTFTLTWTTAFADTPVVILCPNSNITGYVSAASTTGATVVMSSDAAFSFLALGQV